MHIHAQTPAIKQASAHTQTYRHTDTHPGNVYGSIHMYLCEGIFVTIFTPNFIYYVYLHISICVCICEHLYTWILISVCVCAFVCECMCVCLHVSELARVRVCVRVAMRSCVFVVFLH